MGGAGGPFATRPQPTGCRLDGFSQPLTSSPLGVADRKGEGWVIRYREPRAES